MSSKILSLHTKVFISDDAVGDGDGAVVLVGGALAASALVGIRDVAALDEDSGAAGLVEDGEVLALSRVTVADFESTEEAQVDVGCEAFSLFAVVVGFHAVVFGAGVGIKMDADEDCVPVAVGDSGPVGE